MTLKESDRMQQCLGLFQCGKIIHSDGAREAMERLVVTALRPSFIYLSIIIQRVSMKHEMKQHKVANFEEDCSILNRDHA